MITISYAILTHNEDESLEKLLQLLTDNLQGEDEIVIVDDFSDNPKTLSILEYYTALPQVNLYRNRLKKNFAQQKNFLNQKCSKQYIFNLDADELPNQFLLENISHILEKYADIDLFWLPRVNIVTNITQEYLQNNRWHINKHGWINWPDYQGRIYKNKTQIKWENKVHESLTGFYKCFYFPENINYALWHEKPFNKQLQQNMFYNQLEWGKSSFKKIIRLLFS